MPEQGCSTVQPRSQSRFPGFGAGWEKALFPPRPQARERMETALGTRLSTVFRQIFKVAPLNIIFDECGPLFKNYFVEFQWKFRLYFAGNFYTVLYIFKSVANLKCSFSSLKRFNRQTIAGRTQYRERLGSVAILSLSLYSSLSYWAQ